MSHHEQPNIPGEARIPKLIGGLNFRDMGGYPTADGRMVRWGKLFRSGATHELTASDLTFLRKSGIRFAYDLRSNTERHHYPSKLDGIAEIEYHFRDHDQIPGDLMQVLKAGGVRPKECRDQMLTLYRILPYEFRHAYRILFEFLANDNLPLVFNCTAGKDRTGVAAALVLSALGVPRDVIIEDYVLTEEFYEQTYAMLLHGKYSALISGLDRKVWEPLLRSDPDYLKAMFDQLTDTHGSIDQYLFEELGLDPPVIDQLRSNLLETR